MSLPREATYREPPETIFGSGLTESSGYDSLCPVPSSRPVSYRTVHVQSYVVYPPMVTGRQRECIKPSIISQPNRAAHTLSPAPPSHRFFIDIPDLLWRNKSTERTRKPWILSINTCLPYLFIDNRRFILANLRLRILRRLLAGRINPAGWGNELGLMVCSVIG